MRKYLWTTLIALGCVVLWTSPGWSAQNDCIVTTAAPAYTEGQSVPCTLRPDGGEGVHQLDLLAGEDLTAIGAFAGGVFVVEQRYLNSTPKTADFQVKASPGFVHNLVCTGTDAAATAGTIIVYDNTAESGTILYQWDVQAVALTMPAVFPIDTVAAVGIYLGFTTTADVRCILTYR